MKLSIIIVNWNVKKYLVSCLRSIKENQPCDEDEFEIIVVDNASTDGAVEAVRSDFREVRLIINGENRGFAAANNQGIQISKGRYILLLNPDTIVHPHSLDVLLRLMDDNEDVGACGPKLLYEDGTIQPSTRHFPSFRGALYRHTAFRFSPIFRGEYRKWLMKDFNHDEQAEVEQLMGSALMLRRSIIDQLGGMDESFFMYYEEVDLCYRIKQAGWRIVFTPEAVITHVGGRSSRQIPVRNRILMLTSMLRFFRKHRGKFATGIFNCIFKPAIVLRDVCIIAVGAVTYLFAVLVLDNVKRKKSAVRIRNSAIFLVKHSWRLLFRM